MQRGVRNAKRWSWWIFHAVRMETPEITSYNIQLVVGNLSVMAAFNRYSP